MARTIIKSSQCGECIHHQQIFHQNLEYVYCTLRNREYMYGQRIMECDDKTVKDANQ